MPDAATAAFLGAVPVLEGIPEADLRELARVLRRRVLPAGELLWREGDEAQAMVVIVDGRVSISVRLPGDRAAELTTAGPGEVLGEIPLLDGGRHSASARASEPTTLLSLSRGEFAALVLRRHPAAFALKRRIAAIACQRLRRHLAALATSLGMEDGRAADATPPAADLEPCGPPDSAYVRRLAAFHAFDAL